MQTEKERDVEKTRSVGWGMGRRLEHLTHINERLLSAFCVAMREQFAAEKFAPQSDDAKTVSTNGGAIIFKANTLQFATSL